MQLGTAIERTPAMPECDLVLTDVHLATMSEGAAPYGIVENGALLINDGRIAWAGPATELPATANCETRSLDGRWLTPALIDCHTHLVFAGNRAEEFELRLQGVSYEEIARSGGGIMSTVNATRAASDDALLVATAKRLHALQREGVATVEIKSGYGARGKYRPVAPQHFSWRARGAGRVPG
jgi:imidazolonepropionase